MAIGTERELFELRDKLGRLQAENARLSRLLDLQGHDTAPASEQLAVPMAPGMATMASPVSDKLALYGDRFRAAAMSMPSGGRTVAQARAVGCPRWRGDGAKAWIGGLLATCR